VGGKGGQGGSVSMRQGVICSSMTL
jgi:hypothetical protein